MTRDVGEHRGGEAEVHIEMEPVTDLHSFGNEAKINQTAWISLIFEFHSAQIASKLYPGREVQHNFASERNRVSRHSNC
jgi:hypothetical protein